MKHLAFLFADDTALLSKILASSDDNNDGLVFEKVDVSLTSSRTRPSLCGHSKIDKTKIFKTGGY